MHLETPVIAIGRAGAANGFKFFDGRLVSILARFGQQQVVLGVDQCHPACGLARHNLGGEEIRTYLDHPGGNERPS